MQIGGMFYQNNIMEGPKSTSGGGDHLFMTADLGGTYFFNYMSLGDTYLTPLEPGFFATCFL